MSTEQKAIKKKIKVRAYHCDYYGHVNNARYLEFLEEARWLYLEERINIEELHKKNLGFAVVNNNLNYLAEAGLNDILIVESKLERIGNKSIHISQKINKENGLVVLDASAVIVILDSKAGEAIPVSEEMRNLLNS